MASMESVREHGDCSTIKFASENINKSRVCDIKFSEWQAILNDMENAGPIDMRA